jgi:type III restriction enzyme
MDESFFERPILNSPYGYPARHWALDGDGQPSNSIIGSRRRCDLITPIPLPQSAGRAWQAELELGGDDGLSTPEQQ